MADEKKVKKSKKSEKAPASNSEEGSSATTPISNETPSNAIENESAVEDSSPISEPPAPQRKSSEQISGTEVENKNKPLISENDLQRLEEKAKKAEEAHAAEVKVRKELEALNAKLLAEKTALLDSLSGEKGALQDYQERCAKLQAQKNDLENQLRVSITNFDGKISTFKYLVVYARFLHISHFNSFRIFKIV